MLFRRLLGDEKCEYQAHGLAVRGIERHRGGKADKSAQRVFQALDSTVRNGDALSETGRAKALPGKQAFIHNTAGDAVVVLEKQSQVLEQALFARYRDIDGNVGEWQELGDKGH